MKGLLIRTSETMGLCSGTFDGISESSQSITGAESLNSFILS